MKSGSPPPPLPSLARWVIRITTPARHREALEHDLAEEVDRVRRERGRIPALRSMVRELAGVAVHGLRDRFGEASRRPPRPASHPASRRDAVPFLPSTPAATMIDHLVQDLRFCLRSLAKRPGFTAVAAFTLALGIGSTTAIFSVVRGVLLAPLPYDAAERIVQVWNPWSNEPGVSRGRSSMSSGDVADARASVASFEALAAYAPPSSANLTGSDLPERVLVTRATAGLFKVLGADASVGRTYTVEEDRPGGGDVVVLSHELWRRRFGGDPSAVGSTVRIDGVPHRVVGIMPPSFRLPADYIAGQPTEVWTPLALDPANLDRGNQWLHAVARLAPATTLAAANAELAALTRRWIEDGHMIADLPPYYAVPIEEELLGGVRPALLVLFGAVGFVLLIASVNVANLLLVRADGRRTEVALRTALGAGRSRIVRQLLTESVLLAFVGGALGVLFAYLGVRALVALDPASIPRVDEIRIDRGALGFAALSSMATAVLFGFVPALRSSRPDLVGELRADSRAATGGQRRQRFRGALVTVEVALSLVLVIGAALMIRTFAALSRIDVGFDPRGVLTLEVSLPTTEYASPEERTRFHSGLTERLATLPGVSSAGAARTVPLTGRLGGGSLEVEGSEPPRPGEGWLNARWQVVTPGYFETMRYVRLSGRFLGAADRSDGLPAVVVNETMANSFWPGRDPLGMRVRNTNHDVPWFTVVGVVEDVRHAGVVDTPSPTMYLALEQVPLTRGFTPTAMTYALRTSSDPLALVPAAREAVRSLDTNLPVSRVRPMEEVVADALAGPRFTMMLLGIFAAVALSLAMVGIYGILSYTVSQRRQEIGIRVALGAARRSVLSTVIGHGMRLTLAGVGAGLVAALFLTRLMESLLYGVRPLDPVTFLVVPALFALVAFVASYVPARRATAVDPLVALRQE